MVEVLVVVLFTIDTLVIEWCANKKKKKEIAMTYS